MSDKYLENIAAAEEYQDFISDQLRKSEPCILLMPYASQKYQYQKGESANGIEIKFDRKMKETGNVYIETAEKTNPTNMYYVPSGIYRNDNSWLYLIGNYEQAFLFCKRHLQYLHNDTQHYADRHIREVCTPTSKGFVYPISIAVKFWCLHHFKFSK